MAEHDLSGHDPADAADLAQGRLRLDKWLWYARFVKTRSLASKLCGSGSIRLAGTPVTRASQTIRPGDVLTFPLGPHIRVIKVLALAARRGPAPEARALYEDLAPPTPEARLPRI
ncbi:RNA-binding S4 domain-containing protein [Oleisolibacter albus]|uniref:RNA-binding S4 domain-containing protein n=1 Tax=Oleisolibacter albus TaxID=2171757 RepID=UPI000DF25B2F|nr:RNA-binding S4 domain-containing protein [Oleisolibacter albus]